eukprot:g1564.t1
MQGTDDGQTCEEALQKWRGFHKSDPSKAQIVKLIACCPPIRIWDPITINSLQSVTQLSLSTNALIDIPPMELPNLKILALGRNSIKDLLNIGSVSDTLEQLWVSYNKITSLKGILSCKKLKVLYMQWNQVSDWDEIDSLNRLPSLRDILLTNNPIYHQYGGLYSNINLKRLVVLRRCESLERIDGKVMTPDDKRKAASDEELLPLEEKDRFSG